jgi:hypothetical protein
MHIECVGEYRVGGKHSFVSAKILITKRVPPLKLIAHQQIYPPNDSSKHNHQNLLSFPMSEDELP